MVDVSSQSNKVNITVSSSGVSSNVNASGDTTMYYSNKAKEWATSNRIVDGVDYSSKYYAGRANQSALNAQSFAQSAQDSYNQVQAVSEQALINIETKTNEGANELETITERNIEEIIIEKNNSITNIQEVSATEQAELEEIRDDVINYAGIYYEEITDEVVDVNILESGYVSDSELEEALATKQDKGDYLTQETDPIYSADKPNIALKSEIPDVSNLATKTELTNGLATKQAKGDYALVDDIPTLVSELENDSNYATQTQIMQAIASIPQFSISIVDALPETGAKMVLYLVSKGGESPDVYDEYIWIEQTASFEFLGTTAVDLTDYVKKTDYAQINKAGLITPTAYFGLNVDSQGSLHATSYAVDQLKAKSVYTFISKGTLDNVLTQYSKTVLITQANYEALETKDANTLYLIEE